MKTNELEVGKWYMDRVGEYIGKYSTILHSNMGCTEWINIKENKYEIDLHPSQVSGDYTPADMKYVRSLLPQNHPDRLDDGGVIIISSKPKTKKILVLDF